MNENKVPSFKLCDITKLYLLLQKFKKIKKCKIRFEYRNCNGLFISFK